MVKMEDVNNSDLKDTGIATLRHAYFSIAILARKRIFKIIINT